MTIKVSQLFYYPVKSLKGQSIERVQLDAFGPKWDRRFMLVDDNGRFITQRQCPKMNQVGAQVHDNTLLISVEGQQYTVNLNLIPSMDEFRDVRVWDDTINARMIRSEINTRLSAFLKRTVNLCFMDDDTHRQVDLDFANVGDQTSFADGFPLLIVSEASIGFLSNKLGRDISVERFRPNIVLSGCDAFAEDEWKKITINQIEFDLVKPCSRCVIPTLDINSSEKQPDVMQVMLKYRKQGKNVMVGQNAIHSSQGWLNLGDTVTLS